MKPATNMLSGSSKKCLRRPDLFNPPGRKHDDLVGQSHRLDLIMGEIDHHRHQPFVQALQFQPHMDAQFGVKVGQRFVN